MMADEKLDLVTLTDVQKRARRRRSIAIGLVLAAFVLVVYVGAWAKMGASVFHRTM